MKRMRKVVVPVVFRCIVVLLLAPGIGSRARAWGKPVPPGKPAPPPLLQVVGPTGIESALLPLIAGARHRLLVEAYALNDTAIIAALESAAQRGVDVRVMLDTHDTYSSYRLSVLQASGARTRTPNPLYVTHLSMVVVDATMVAVLTTKIMTEALGPTGAGYMVVDRDRYDVLQAASIFYDDWLRRPIHRFGHNLLLLPDPASKDQLISVIDGATKSLDLYTSGLSDPDVLSSLKAARARSVTIRVLTQQSGNPRLLYPLAGGGAVHFRDAGGGTLIIADRRVVLLGSMDLSTATLTNNRELAVMLDTASIAATVETSFLAAYTQGRVLTLPAPPAAGHCRSLAVRKLKASFCLVSRLVHLGGEGVETVRTTPGAEIQAKVTYLKGGQTVSTPVNKDHADTNGLFAYRFTIPTGVKPGSAMQVHIYVQSGHDALFDNENYYVLR